MVARTLAFLSLVVSLALVAHGHQLAGKSEVNILMNANPIRKVVTLLQNMQKKVTAEGAKEQILFDKFMCYCKNGAATLTTSITDAENKVPQVQSSINEGVAQKAQLETELKNHQADRSDAKDAIAKATSIREKDAQAFAKESSESKQNIKALKGAIQAVSSGMSGGFLQTNSAAIVRNLAMDGPNLEDSDRQEIMSFLSGKQAGGYAPARGEITGILKSMADTMSKSLGEMTSDEASSKTSFDELLSAKEKQIASLTKAIESKSKRVGELGVELAMLRNDLDDTQEALVQDKKFSADLAKNCATKQDEKDASEKVRAQEMVALADTIKILNDDDALELFKKTLPGAAGLMQLAETDSSMKSKALQIIRQQQARHPSVNLGFLTLAMQGKAMGFEKVIKMVDNMVIVLKKQQTDDEQKQDYCNKQIDEKEDKKKSLEQSRKDFGTAIANAEEEIASTNSDLAALAQGIADLDKQTGEATVQRKDENAVCTELKASNAAAKQILGFAKNRLNKFYNPKQYKAPPKRNLGFMSMHFEGISLAQISATSNSDDYGFMSMHFEGFPGEAPEAPGGAKKHIEESNGVLAMVDLLVQDLDKEVQEAEVNEKASQKEYTQMMADAKDKRAEDAKMITAKESSKANLESELEDAKDDHTATTNELLATVDNLAAVNKDCGWLLENFDVRKAARASEVDALGKAKAVLSGADYAAVL